jgi:hypothetical protein
VQVAGGERQQLQQTAPQALQEDGVLQSKQPLAGKTKTGYGFSNQGGHYGILCVQVKGNSQHLIIWTLNSY